MHIAVLACVATGATGAILAAVTSAQTLSEWDYMRLLKQAMESKDHLKLIHCFTNDWDIVAKPQLIFSDRGTIFDPVWGATLPHLVVPHADEWLLGLFLLCDLANGWFAGTTARLVAVAPLAESPRVSPGFFITATLFDLNRLAELIAVPAIAVADTVFKDALGRFNTARESHARTLGAPTWLRVCPACIADDHLLLKSSVLTGVSTCTVHQLVLQSLCACAGALFPWGKRTQPFTSGACGQPWANLPRQLDGQAHANEQVLHGLYAAMLSSHGRNTYSRARLLIREVVDRRVAAGERLGISPEVRGGRVLIEAGPSVAALVAGLAQFGIAPTDVAEGFEGDLSAEHAQHKQIKFGLAAARFWARV
jgi:hypothetical protein